MIGLRNVLIGSFAAFVLSVSTAQAASVWPPSVVGTWNMTANNFELNFNITHQNGTGTCKRIIGKLVNVGGGGQSVIEGFYCPGTGRITFLREDPMPGGPMKCSAGTFRFRAAPATLADRREPAWVACSHTMSRASRWANTTSSPAPLAVE